MKNYTDSDYALNKFSKGIVYRFADGIAEVNLDNYLAENPGKTEDDFLALKELSDSIYLEQVTAENSQTYRNTFFDELDETALCQVPSPEDIFIGAIDAQKQAEQRKERLRLARRALDKLTEVQRRRYLQYHVKGLTVREIADEEGSHFTTVHESLQAADKKIKKFLANG